MISKTPQELNRAIEQIALAVGTPPDYAQELAGHLVGAHLAGHDSHGIQHMARYVREVHAGEIDPAARPEVLSQTAGTALVSGRWGWGHVTTAFCTRLGVEMARSSGIALLSAVEVNHIGRLGHYVERAAAEGVILFLVCGGLGHEKPAAATYGGSKAILAPNPIAMGFPATQDAPVVIDFATTQIAGGKIALAKAKRQSIPSGSIIDKDGKPSTNPDDYYNGGALLPFGGHKGSAVMVATEILGRILPGADAFCDLRRNVHQRHAGVTLIAIDSAAFSPAELFAARTAELVTRIRSVPPAEGFDEVEAPGDHEIRARCARSKGTIDIPESTWDEVVATAQALGAQL